MALSAARWRAPRYVGRAIATRMPMIRTTTMSSIRVKPRCEPMRALGAAVLPPRVLRPGARRLGSSFISPPKTFDFGASLEAERGGGHGAPPPRIS